MSVVPFVFNVNDSQRSFSLVLHECFAFVFIGYCSAE